MLSQILSAVAELLDAHVDELQLGPPVGGGSIHQAWRVDHADGKSFFVKGGEHASREMFLAEAAGLRALASAGSVRVPRDAGVAAPIPLLVMEWIDVGERPEDFGERLGRGLAELHLHTERPRFGFEHDNWIGATPQPNEESNSWVDFWRRHRLLHQLHLARTNGLGGSKLQALGERLAERLDDWIARPEEAACLLHGDLWPGNVLCDTSGLPVLVDPAAYYGRREADLAMTFVFGGFDRGFYDAYRETHPLEPGWRERMRVYELYHLLNHLNLFGESYLASCTKTLRELVD